MKNTNLTTGALCLDELTELQLRSLHERGHIARRWGSCSPFLPASEYWTLTAKGEKFFHLV